MPKRHRDAVKDLANVLPSFRGRRIAEVFPGCSTIPCLTQVKYTTLAHRLHIIQNARQSVRIRPCKTWATRSGERARFVGLFQGCTGLWTGGSWLARRLHQLKASTTMDLGISTFLIFVRGVTLRNLDLMIKTDWSVICPLCC